MIAEACCLWQHNRCNLRCISKVGDAGFNNFQTGICYFLLDFITDASGYDFTGTAKTSLICYTIPSGTLHWVLRHKGKFSRYFVRAVTLQGKIFLIVIYVENSFRSICYTPHNGNSDFYRISQAVVDLLTLLFKVMIFREIFLFTYVLLVEAEVPVASVRTDLAAFPPSTSPLWFSLVFAAGFTAVQKGFTQ